MKTNRALCLLLMAVTVAAFWPTTASGRRPPARDAVQTATRRPQMTNRWRYVWHNDRWWYWTFNERWSYFDGRRWTNYDPRHAASGALAGGYRKAPAFEKPPAASPSPPGSWPAPTLQSEAALTMPFNSDLHAAPSRVGGDVAESRPPRERGRAAEDLRGLGRLPAPRPPRAGGTRTGGGGFGGPRGTSLGAGSAAGGASSPQ